MPGTVHQCVYVPPVETGDWTIGILTAALVVITGYYAWQNRRMVSEMAAARALTVRPHLAIKWHSAAPMITFPELVSVGPGPALDVDVEVIFVPKGESGASEDRRRWQANLLPAGEAHHFLTRNASDGSILKTDELAAMYERIDVRGTMRDVLGTTHQVEDSLDDLAGWRELQLAALVHWQHPDAERRLADALAKEFKKPLTDVATSLRQWTAVMREQLRRGQRDDAPEG